LYKISQLDGSIVWRLGGQRSDFEISPEAKFGWQHHARVQGQTEARILISLFDNAKGSARADGPTTRMNSAGLLLALDMKTMKVQLEARFDKPQGGYTWKRGSMQLLPNGNAFMGWADRNAISEHASGGEVLLEAEMIQYPMWEPIEATSFFGLGDPKAIPTSTHQPSLRVATYPPSST
jgi:hypothetical protein